MRIRTLAFAFFALGLAACKSAPPGSGNETDRGPTVVQVDNQGFLDMAVYAVRSGQRVRLGNAAGNSKTTFKIPQSLTSGLTTLRFVADPIGGRRASVSEEITVVPGDTVVLTIPPI